MPARLQYNLRSLRRLFAFAWSLCASGAVFVFRSSHRRTLKSRTLWLQASCRAALRALGVSHSSDGNPPVHGTVIVANHLSYVDILVLAASTPVVFVAKREVRSWPVFGWFARMAGTRFVDRKRRSDVARAGRELSLVVAEGISVVLFLEGTSTDGQTVLPFKSSLLEPAVQAGCPLAPVALGYRVPLPHSAAQDVCYWGEMTLVPHLFNLAGLTRIDAQIAWGDSVRPAVGRKALARTLHDRVVQLHRGLGRIAPSHVTTNQTELSPAFGEA